MTGTRGQTAKDVADFQSLSPKNLEIAQEKKEEFFSCRLSIISFISKFFLLHSGHLSIHYPIN